MPNFTDKLAQIVQEHYSDFHSTFSEEALTPQEKILKERMGEIWNILPESSSLNLPDSYAVDGSQATRTLANGAFLVICQALIIGPNFEDTSVAIELVRGSAGQQDLDRFADLLRQKQELSLALRHASRLSGKILLLDGTLHGQMRIMDRGPLHLEGYENLPEQVLGIYLDLLEQIEENKIQALGISKTSRESLLMKPLLKGTDLENPVKIPDSEILYRWTRNPGFTSPLLLGIRGREPSDSEEKYLVERLRKAPAILAFHTRLASQEDTLRVDLPASALGFPERALEAECEFIQTDPILPVVKYLRATHGGPNVYNALLYIVDKEVRLHQKTVTGAYMAILRDITGEQIVLDRSKRRFMK